MDKDKILKAFSLISQEDEEKKRKEALTKSNVLKGRDLMLNGSKESISQWNPKDDKYASFAQKGQRFFEDLVDKAPNPLKGFTEKTGRVLFGSGQRPEDFGGENQGTIMGAVQRSGVLGGYTEGFVPFGQGKTNYDRYFERYNGLVAAGVEDKRAGDIASTYIKPTQGSALDMMKEEKERKALREGLAVTPEEKDAIKSVAFFEALDTGFGALDFLGIGSLSKVATKNLLKNLAKETTEEGTEKLLKTLPVDERLLTPEIKTAFRESKTVEETTEIYKFLDERSAALRSAERRGVVEEAKNFNTADEFIASQGDTVYHGGSPIGDVDMAKSKAAKDSFFVTDNPEYAAKYAKANDKGVVNEFVIDPNANLIDLRNATPEQIQALKNQFRHPSAVRGARTGISTNELIEGAIRGKSHFAEDDALVQAYKELGYDGVVSTEEMGSKNIMVWNKDVLKSKAQLNDIYNTAQSLKEANKTPIEQIQSGNIKEVTPQEIAQANQGSSGQSLSESINQANIENSPKIQDGDTRGTNRSSENKNSSLNKSISQIDEKTTPSLTNKDNAQIPKYLQIKEKIEKKWTNVVRKFQDNWVDVRKALEKGDTKMLKTLNPYDKEQLMHGRVATRIEEVNDTFKTIDKDIVKIQKKYKQTTDEVNKNINEYLHAIHAPERNAKLGSNAAGITDEQAFDILKNIDDLEYADDVKRIGKELIDINKKTLQTLLDGQVITKDSFDTLSQTYANHVPLNRIIDETDDVAQVLGGRGLDVRSTGLKKAKGSAREVDDIMFNIMANSEQAITKAEKNLVDLSLLEQGRKQPELDLFEEISPKDPTDAVKVAQNDQVLQLFEKGEKRYLYIKDKNIADAFKAAKVEHLPPIANFIGEFTRLYSGLATRYNPDFLLSNKVRDLQEMMIYTASKKELGGKDSLKALANDPRSWKDVTDYLRGADTEGARLYKQMKMDGGTTGGLGLSTRKQLRLDLDKIRNTNRSNPRKATQSILGFIDNLNTIVEDSTRLATYRTALEKGLTRDQAAVLAKNVTINFNKKGNASPVINALYMFSNASIQGTTKMLKAMKNPKVAATVVGSITMATYATEKWNDMVDPNWREVVTEWDRNSNLVIALPSEDGEITYMTIPVSYGIKPIKVAASSVFDFMKGKQDDIAKAFGGVVASVIEGYNPLGGSDVFSAITPTIADTPFDIARNTAWHGGKIRPDWNENAPDYTQYFDSLKDTRGGQLLIKATELLNEKGIDVSPQNMKYAIDQYSGGSGRFIERVVNSITGLVTGDRVKPQDVPFLNRFVKTRNVDEALSASDRSELSQLVNKQEKDKAILSNEAERAYERLINLKESEGSAAAKKEFANIVKDNPELKEKIESIAKEEKSGLTMMDRKIKILGVENGNRSEYIASQIEKLETKEEKAAYYKELKDKKIITDEVARQIKIRLKK